jgi:glutathione S-transferase
VEHFRQSAKHFIRRRGTAITNTEDSMKLYYSPGAYSLSPHIVASEAGIPIELEKADVASHKPRVGKIMSLSIRKAMPLLCALMTAAFSPKARAIVHYLADQKPATGLAPAAGTIERYRV